ncbi:hypothetical protein OAH12_03140, partial [Cyclobacteriaceae bacterium]|nr:hypothetical protein [Cyclobacteriaceae bacterium]
MNRLLIIIGIVIIGVSCRKDLDSAAERTDYFVKFIGTSHDQEGEAVVENVLGELYIIGKTSKEDLINQQTYTSMYLTKTTSSGEVIWSQSYNDTDTSGFFRNVEGVSLQFTQDGGLILYGTSVERGGSEAYTLLIKVDLNGNVLWRQKHQFDTKSYANYVYSLNDGSGYLLVGYNSNDTTGRELYIARTRIDGSVDSPNAQDSWVINKSGSTGDSYIEASRVIEHNGQYVIVGSSNEAFSSNITQAGINAIVFTVYPNALFGPKRTFGGLNDDFGYDIKRLSNGKFVVLGTTNSYSNIGSQDCFIVELDDPTSDPNNGYHTFGTVNSDWGYQMVVNADNSVTVCGS